MGVADSGSLLESESASSQAFRDEVKLLASGGVGGCKTIIGIDDDVLDGK